MLESVAANDAPRGRLNHTHDALTSAAGPRQPHENHRWTRFQATHWWQGRSGQAGGCVQLRRVPLCRAANTGLDAELLVRGIGQLQAGQPLIAGATTDAHMWAATAQPKASFSAASRTPAAPMQAHALALRRRGTQPRPCVVRCPKWILPETTAQRPLIASEQLCCRFKMRRLRSEVRPPLQTLRCGPATVTGGPRGL